MVERAGEVITQAADAIVGAISNAIEDSTNAVERATGLDLDGDGDVGVKGHGSHRDLAGAAEHSAAAEQQPALGQIGAVDQADATSSS